MWLSFDSTRTNVAGQLFSYNSISASLALCGTCMINPNTKGEVRGQLLVTPLGHTWTPQKSRPLPTAQSSLDNSEKTFIVVPDTMSSPSVSLSELSEYRPDTKTISPGGSQQPFLRCSVCHAHTQRAPVLLLASASNKEHTAFEMLSFGSLRTPFSQ